MFKHGAIPPYTIKEAKMAFIGHYGNDYDLGLFIDAILFDGNDRYSKPLSHIARMELTVAPGQKSKKVIGRLYDYPAYNEATKQVFVPLRNPENFIVFPVENDIEDEAESVDYHGLTLSDL